MSRKTPIALWTLSLCLACGGEGSSRDSGPSSTGGKGDNLGETDTDGATGGGDASDHRAAVEECELVAEHVREHLHGSRVDQIVDLERDRNDCLVRANDSARGPIEAVLSAAGDPFAGQAQPAWAKHRTTAVNACNALVEAHADAAGDAIAGFAATCIADTELQLAEVLDAYVDFGGAPFPIPGARDRYPACYDAFEDEVANAGGVADAAAVDSLAGCIREVHDALVPELAARVAANFPGREAAQVEVDLRGAMFDLQSARERTCELAVHGGPWGPDFAPALAECHVDLAIQGGAVLDLVAPGLLEGGGDTGGGDTGSGDTDGGSGSTSA